VVVVDEVLDAIDDRGAAGPAVAKIVQSSDILVKCGACGRIAIEDHATGVISIFSKEKR
jgi:hypothetical protein